jgi:hypothetical protein
MSLEKEQASGEQWTLDSWIALVNPSERQWHWWDARLDSLDVARVVVAVDGMPAGLGTLDFLLYASGAAEVSNDA